MSHKGYQALSLDIRPRRPLFTATDLSSQAIKLREAGAEAVFMQVTGCRAAAAAFEGGTTGRPSSTHLRETRIGATLLRGSGGQRS